jgi:hypothetical protein
LLLEDINNKSYSSTKKVLKVDNFLFKFLFLLFRKLLPLISLISLLIVEGVGILSFSLLLNNSLFVY